jgi:hypothetical protein
MRRVMRRNEQNTSEIELIGGGAGHRQMSVVNRVECAAK